MIEKEVIWDSNNRYFNLILKFLLVFMYVFLSKNEGMNKLWFLKSYLGKIYFLRNKRVFFGEIAGYCCVVVRVFVVFGVFKVLFNFYSNFEI